jgi:hypothetical protein
MNVKPEIRVKALGFGGDPTFEAGESKTARAQLTNPTTKSFTYTVELYLGVTKAATSGVGTVTIGAGQSIYVDFPIVMPLAEGVYEVYLDVSVDTTLLAHYKATENVTLVITPKIVVGPIIWV